MNKIVKYTAARNSDRRAGDRSRRRRARRVMVATPPRIGFGAGALVGAAAAERRVQQRLLLRYAPGYAYDYAYAPGYVYDAGPGYYVTDVLRL